MLDTNTIAITVATGDHHVQVVDAKLHAIGLRQSAAVQAVEAVGVDVAGQVRRAANTRDYHQVFGMNPQLTRCSLQSAQDAKVPTSGAPIRIDRALIGFEW